MKNLKRNYIRMRIAPAPTGNLHLGSIYIFYYNLLAYKSLLKKQINNNNLKNYFYLRIDNTNQTKNDDKFIKNIIRDLELFNIKYDKIFFQNKRYERYFNIAIKMVENNQAYICNCANKKEEKDIKKGIMYNRNCLNKNLPFIENKSVIRFYNKYRNSNNEEYKNIDDFIIIKSNKKAISVFAGAIDDSDYKITHVMRGADWILSTSKQILILKSINFPTPLKYYHLNLIKNLKNQKLSKSSNDISIYSMITKQGYLVSAIKNWILLIGYKRTKGGKGYKRLNNLFKTNKNNNWCFAQKIEKEYLTEIEIESNFNIIFLKNKSPCYDPNKLKWINKIHMREKKTIEIYNDLLKLEIYQKYKNSIDKKKLLFFIKQLKKTKNNLIDLFTEIKIIMLTCQQHFKLFKKYIEKLKNDQHNNQLKIFLKSHIKEIYQKLFLQNNNCDLSIKNFVLTDNFKNQLNVDLLIKNIAFFRNIIFLKSNSFSNKIILNMYHNNIYFNAKYILKCLQYLLNYIF